MRGTSTETVLVPLQQLQQQAAAAASAATAETSRTTTTSTSKATVPSTGSSSTIILVITLWRHETEILTNATTSPRPDRHHEQDPQKRNSSPMYHHHDYLVGREVTTTEKLVQSIQLSGKWKAPPLSSTTLPRNTVLEDAHASFASLLDTRFGLGLAHDTQRMALTTMMITLFTFFLFVVLFFIAIVIVLYSFYTRRVVVQHQLGFDHDDLEDNESSASTLHHHNEDGASSLQQEHEESSQEDQESESDTSNDDDDSDVSFSSGSSVNEEGTHPSVQPQIHDDARPRRLDESISSRGSSWASSTELQPPAIVRTQRLVQGLSNQHLRGKNSGLPRLGSKEMPFLQAMEQYRLQQRHPPALVVLPSMATAVACADLTTATILESSEIPLSRLTLSSASKTIKREQGLAQPPASATTIASPSLTTASRVITSASSKRQQRAPTSFVPSYEQKQQKQQFSSSCGGVVSLVDTCNRPASSSPDLQAQKYPRTAFGLNSPSLEEPHQKNVSCDNSVKCWNSGGAGSSSKSAHPSACHPQAKAMCRMNDAWNESRPGTIAGRTIDDDSPASFHHPDSMRAAPTTSVEKVALNEEERLPKTSTPPSPSSTCGEDVPEVKGGLLEAMSFLSSSGPPFDKSTLVAPASLPMEDQRTPHLEEAALPLLRVVTKTVSSSNPLTDIIKRSKHETTATATDNARHFEPRRLDYDTITSSQINQQPPATPLSPGMDFLPSLTAEAVLHDHTLVSNGGSITTVQGNISNHNQNVDYAPPLDGTLTKTTTIVAVHDSGRRKRKCEEAKAPTCTIKATTNRTIQRKELPQQEETSFLRGLISESSNAADTAAKHILASDQQQNVSKKPRYDSATETIGTSVKGSGCSSQSSPINRTCLKTNVDHEIQTIVRACRKMTGKPTVQDEAVVTEVLKPLSRVGGPVDEADQSAFEAPASARVGVGSLPYARYLDSSAKYHKNATFDEDCCMDSIATNAWCPGEAGPSDDLDKPLHPHVQHLDATKTGLTVRAARCLVADQAAQEHAIYKAISDVLHTSSGCSFHSSACRSAVSNVGQPLYVQGETASQFQEVTTLPRTPSFLQTDDETHVNSTAHNPQQSEVGCSSSSITDPSWGESCQQRPATAPVPVEPTSACSGEEGSMAQVAGAPSGIPMLMPHGMLDGQRVCPVELGHFRDATENQESASLHWTTSNEPVAKRESKNWTASMANLPDLEAIQAAGDFHAAVERNIAIEGGAFPLQVPLTTVTSSASLHYRNIQTHYSTTNVTARDDSCKPSPVSHASTLQPDSDASDDRPDLGRPRKDDDTSSEARRMFSRVLERSVATVTTDNLIAVPSWSDKNSQFPDEPVSLVQSEESPSQIFDSTEKKDSSLTDDDGPKALSETHCYSNETRTETDDDRFKSIFPRRSSSEHFSQHHTHPATTKERCLSQRTSSASDRTLEYDRNGNDSGLHNAAVKSEPDVGDENSVKHVKSVVPTRVEDVLPDVIPSSFLTFANETLDEDKTQLRSNQTKDGLSQVQSVVKHRNSKDNVGGATKPAANRRLAKTSSSQPTPKKTGMFGSPAVETYRHAKPRAFHPIEGIGSQKRSSWSRHPSTNQFSHQACQKQDKRGIVSRPNANRKVKKVLSQVSTFDSDDLSGPHECNSSRDAQPRAYPRNKNSLQDSKVPPIPAQAAGGSATTSFPSKLDKPAGRDLVMDCDPEGKPRERVSSGIATDGSAAKLTESKVSIRKNSRNHDDSTIKKGKARRRLTKNSSDNGSKHRTKKAKRRRTS